MMRVALVALVVFGLQWRFADPLTIIADAERSAIPWAMAALLPIFALGAWTYEVAAVETGGFKADALWGLLAATVCYLATVVATLVA